MQCFLRPARFISLRTSHLLLALSPRSSLVSVCVVYVLKRYHLQPWFVKGKHLAHIKYLSSIHRTNWEHFSFTATDMHDFGVILSADRLGG